MHFLPRGAAGIWQHAAGGNRKRHRQLLTVPSWRRRESKPYAVSPNANDYQHVTDSADLRSGNCQEVGGVDCPEPSSADRRLKQLAAVWNSLPTSAQDALVRLAAMRFSRWSRSPPPARRLSLDTIAICSWPVHREFIVRKALIKPDAGIDHPSAWLTRCSRSDNVARTSSKAG